MQKTYGQNDPKVVDYVEKLLNPEDRVLVDVRRASVENGLPEIQVGPLDALHLEVLTRAVGAKKIVEIGTLGGYSGIAFCRGMGATGKLYTFELQQRNADVARKNFERADVSQQVEIFVGPALNTLPQIEGFGPFDLVFIDADKSNYCNYLDWAHKNLRKGGVVLADNTFAWGLVVDGAQVDEQDKNSVLGLRAFNRKIAASSSGFRVTMLPTGEGLTLAVKN
ncbi:MAG TPA: O-methyltransferase [Oligoflexia bacterium]|nr:O-methyltransferase [Oligoflexia bacterium]